MDEWKPIRFIDEPIAVFFEQAPAFSKRPHCPNAFEWRGERYAVVETLSEWCDYRRRGRFESNMEPEHAALAAVRGSWGVGRFYFRVRTQDGRVFDLYYDRAPRGSADRAGAWVLFRELELEPDVRA